MKKTILLVFIMFSLTIFVNAQVKFGVSAGFNTSILTNNDDYYDDYYYHDNDNNEIRAGGFIGIYSRMKIGNRLYFRPEVQFSMQGGDRRYRFYENGKRIKVVSESKLNYINVPLMLQYEFFKGFRGEFGPQLGFNVHSRYKQKLYTYDNYGKNKTKTKGDLDVKTFDIALNIGANYEFDNGFNCGVRYSIGLIDVEDSDSRNTVSGHNSVFSIVAGYTF